MIERVHGERKKSYTGRILVAATAALLVVEVLALRRRDDDVPTISAEVWRATEAHPTVSAASGVVCGHWFVRLFEGWRGVERVTLPWALGALVGAVAWGKGGSRR
jgi:hypothetical protein